MKEEIDFKPTSFDLYVLINFWKAQDKLLKSCNLKVSQFGYEQGEGYAFTYSPVEPECFRFDSIILESLFSSGYDIYISSIYSDQNQVNVSLLQNAPRLQEAIDRVNHRLKGMKAVITSLKSFIIINTKVR